MTPPPVTERLAGFASGLAYDAIPGAVVDHLKLLILDLAGIMIRAGRELPSTHCLTGGLHSLGLAEGPVRAFSVPGGFAPPAAALVDAMAAHSLDFDDTHATASTHPGAPSIAAALAVAQVAKADGRALLAAIVAGYEVHLRLSLALVPREHYGRGHALTSTCGAFGAAAAAGRLLGLTPEQMAHAFGIALNQASGSLQFLEGGTWAKRFQVGYAAFNGVVAAFLAKSGFEGARNAIEGRYGFLHNYSGSPQAAEAVAGLGERFETLNTGVKPYPVCRYAHAAMDAVIALRNQHGIKPGDARRIVIGLGRTGWELVGQPEAEKQAPATVVDGQFSMPYCAAVALTEGRMDWEDLGRHLRRAGTLELCRRVTTEIDPRVEAMAPRHMAGAASIETERGTVSALVEIPLGEPENFPSLADLRAKLHGLVSPYLGPAEEDDLVEAISGLDRLRDPATLHAKARAKERSPVMEGA